MYGVAGREKELHVILEPTPPLKVPERWHGNQLREKQEMMTNRPAGVSEDVQVQKATAYHGYHFTYFGAIVSDNGSKPEVLDSNA